MTATAELIAEKPPAPPEDLGVFAADADHKRLLLAGLRVAWLRAKSALDEIEDVAVALKSGCITPDQAAKHCLMAGIITMPERPDGG